MGMVPNRSPHAERRRAETGPVKRPAAAPIAPAAATQRRHQQAAVIRVTQQQLTAVQTLSDGRLQDPAASSAGQVKLQDERDVNVVCPLLNVHDRRRVRHGVMRRRTSQYTRLW